VGSCGWCSTSRVPKGPNGVGSVYQEKGRQWTSEAWVDLPDGRRRRVRGRGASPAAAIRARVAKERELVERNPAASDLTVSVLIERWLSGAHASSWAAETRRSYRVAVRHHILPELGQARVQLVTAFDVQRVLDRILAANEGHVSVANRVRRVLHTIFNHAVAWGIRDSNPVAAVKPIRRAVREQAYWTREEAQAFLTAADASPYRLLFEAALSTGLRIGELVALRWRDFDGGMFHVRRTYSQGAVGRVQDHPKSRTSNRRVPLPPGLAERLSERRGEPEALVFPSRTGRLLNPGNVHRALRNYAAKAGVPVIRVHDLRRTYASLLAEDGYHPSVIQRLLGHASPDLALRVYTSAHESRLEAATVDLGGQSGGHRSGHKRLSAVKVTPTGGRENREQVAEMRRAPVAQVDRAGDS